MKSMVGFYVALLMLFSALPATVPVVSGITFSQPEIRLIEELFIARYQNEIDVSFDFDGNVHAVWNDDREGIYKIYGNTILTTGSPIGSYSCHAGISAETYVMPSIVSDMSNPYGLFVIGTALTTPAQLIGSSYDINYLPDSVHATDLMNDLELTPPITVDGLTAIWTDVWVNFVFEYDGSLYYGDFEYGSEIWTLRGSITPSPEDEYVTPSLAKDSDGFIYLCYTTIDSFSITSTLVAQRSNDQFSFLSGFGPQREIVQVGDTNGFVSSISATGAFFNSDLQVAVIFYHNSAIPPYVTCVCDHNGDWMSSLGFNGVFNNLNPGIGNYVNGLDIAYDSVGRLYAVYVDDRSSIPQIYGSTSYDYGDSFTLDQHIPTNGYEILEQPSLAVGYTPGNIAVGYIHKEGALPHHPYILVSQSEFFDTCDFPPDIFWDSYGGVEADYALYHGLTGDGVSYRLITGEVKGELIRDYGTVENQGALELYFYDPVYLEPGAAEFSVALNNDNLKGVIRMLGVRNDTNQSNYSYHDGSQWVDWGGARTVGWHHIIVTVNDDGIVMQLESSPGSYLSYQDMDFTSFTSIEIEGGGTSDPYNVDDIRVETYPVPLPPPPLPVDSGMAVLMSLAAIGSLLLKKRL